MVKWMRQVAMGLMLFSFLSCAQAFSQEEEVQTPDPFEQRLREQPEVYDFTTWFIGKGPYTLGRDDVIRIEVRNQPEFSGEFTVGPTGKIQYNYLGDVHVAGLTKTEMEEILTQMLGMYVRVPEVLVTITGYNSKVV